MIIDEIKGNKILLVVGKSGSGKSLFSDKLVQEYNLTPLDSFTTRPKRYENEQGHIFIDFEEGQKRISDKKYIKNIVGFTIYNGHYYWSTKNQIDESDIYVVDKQGVETFKRHYKGNKQALVVYIETNVFKRFLYMLRRGDGVKKTISRIWYDRTAFKGIEHIANIVIRNNSTIEHTIEQFKDMLYFFK